MNPSYTVPAYAGREKHTSPMNAQTLNARYDTAAKLVAPALAFLLAVHPPQFAFTVWAALKCIGLVVLFHFGFDLLQPALLRPLLRKKTNE